MKIKQLVLGLILCVVLTGQSFSLSTITNDSYLGRMTRNERQMIKNMSKRAYPDEIIEEMWYKERIPKEYADAFLYYTEDKKEIRMNFYSLMVHESGNFKRFVNKNIDGSYDYGPSQLNSRNLTDENFQKAFRPTDESHITSRYCFYMVETINFYWDLYNTYGEDLAFYGYNGGPKAIRLKKAGWSVNNSSIVRNTTNYNDTIVRLISKHTAELKEFNKEFRESNERVLTEKFIGIYKTLVREHTRRIVVIHVNRDLLPNNGDIFYKREEILDVIDEIYNYTRSLG